MRRAVVIAFVTGCSLVGACSDTPPSSQTATPPPAAATPPAAAPTQPVTSTPAVPVPLRDAGGVPEAFRDLWKTAASGGTVGKHGDYTYQYAVTGDKAAAVMLPRPIPRDDTVLVATINDLARRAFRANLGRATPRIEATRHGNAIAFTAAPYTYYVLTIKNETREGTYGPGEPHTLLVWRER